MMTIPVTAIQTPEGVLNAPSEPIPTNAIAIFCDGVSYSVYLPGDTLPAVSQD